MKREQLNELFEINLASAIRTDKSESITDLKTQKAAILSQCDHKWPSGEASLYNDPLLMTDQVECSICKKVWKG